MVENKAEVGFMKLSVIVPTYNEAATVGLTLKRLIKQSIVSQIVVVDDGSTDQTAAVVSKISDKRIRLIRHDKNQGKGAAIKTGLVEVIGDYVLIQDADLEYDPRDISLLVQPIIDKKAAVVYGSRFTGPHKNMFFWHMLGNKLLSLLVNILFNTTLSDMETCYKLMPTQLLKDVRITETDFAIEPEITCKILKKKYFIYEVPISYTGRTFEEGKKISWRDGIKAFVAIWRYRIL